MRVSERGGAALVHDLFCASAFAQDSTTAWDGAGRTLRRLWAKLEGTDMNIEEATDELTAFREALIFPSQTCRASQNVAVGVK